MQVWLPISHGGRTRNILIPYSHTIDPYQLDDIIAWQREKTLDELKKLPTKPISIMPKEQVAEALNDYMHYVRRRNG